MGKNESKYLFKFQYNLPKEEINFMRRNNGIAKTFCIVAIWNNIFFKI